MSDTRYSLGPNITYRLLTESSDLDVVLESTGFDQSSRITDSEDVRSVQSITDFEQIIPKSKAFEDGWVTKTGPQNDYNCVLVVIECDGNPMVVFGTEICKINSDNAHTYGCASRLDEMNGKWVHLELFRMVHPNYRGMGLNDLSIRGVHQLFVSDYGHNFCGANLEFSNRVSVTDIGITPSCSVYTKMEDTGSNTDYVNFYKGLYDNYLSRPDEYEYFTLPDIYGDCKIFVDKTSSLTRRICRIPEVNRFIPYWILSESDWAKSCRDLCEFEYNGSDTCYFNFMKMFEFRDENGDLYYECPDYTKFSYDTSDQKFYINEPGYDFIQYISNNIDVPSVRKSPERTAQLLNRYKNI